MEDAFLKLQEKYPQQVRVKMRFQEGLSHQIEAGADFFLMPSLFEPCGLNQMYSLRYGTVPVVRATGGLDDTVVDLAVPHATGIKFQEPSSDALWNASEKALALYATPVLFKEVQRRGMACDFSWEKSAREYEAVYRGLADATFHRASRKHSTTKGVGNDQYTASE